MVAPHSPDPIDARKRALRAELAAGRHRLHGDALRALHDHVGLCVARHAPRFLAMFAPLGDEPDLGALLPGFRAAGITPLLPVVRADAAPLEFREWGDEALVPGRLGTRAPGPGAPARAPDLLLVPFVAADAAGRRLGRGGGFYDRTLAARPDGVTAIGVGPASRLVDAVPVGPFDAPLDAVVTEHGIMVADRAGRARSA